MKFRVWDKIKKEFIFTNEEGGLSFELGGKSFHSFIINRFSGFKDVDGNPIYDNDIINYSKDKKSSEKEINGFIGTVVFVDEFLRWDVFITKESFVEVLQGILPKLKTKKFVKVIGNTYQNKELLNYGENNE